MSTKQYLSTFLYLVPFLVMLLLQKLLNYDDNLMALPSPGKRDGQSYNLVMLLVFWIGCFAYFVYMIRNAQESYSWLLVKAFALVLLFAIIFLLAS